MNSYERDKIICNVIIIGIAIAIKLAVFVGTIYFGVQVFKWAWNS